MPWSCTSRTRLPTGSVREAGNDAGRQVDRAYRLAFGRLPEPDERAQAVKVVERAGLPALARAIFNCNEFLYFD